ncbi:glycosyltransferase family 8 protein [Sporolactobacillus vineae]|uniref:glycosyltransferase family 8 protein n=1 Tax=Sporolactobacillus vineae TaxID=444463 RepID=UPI00028A0AF2|nr:glycosyltransferase family 8 protein [Sporolactobacillus vineae]
MNILVALNANYLYPLRVMLRSLFINNPEAHFHIYLMHSELTRNQIEKLRLFVARQGQELSPIYVSPDLFGHAAVHRHFSSEMYYRLIACRYLPDSVDRILYLDPDIVVLNSVEKFYGRSFHHARYIAAEHGYSARMARTFNKIRLKTPAAKGYYNTGVLLINVRKLKSDQPFCPVIRFIESHRHQLLLPDQDVFNALYWDQVIPAAWPYYNYDARYYDLAKLLPNRKKASQLSWIETHTVFLHFCGKQKPWQKNYRGELGFLFRCYAEDTGTRKQVTGGPYAD